MQALGLERTWCTEIKRTEAKALQNAWRDLVKSRRKETMFMVSWKSGVVSGNKWK